MSAVLRTPRASIIGATVLLLAACGESGNQGPGIIPPPSAPAIEQLLGTAVIDVGNPWPTLGVHDVAWLELSSDPWPFAFPPWEVPLGWYAEHAFDQFVVDIPAELEAELTDGFWTEHHVRYQVGSGVQGYAPGSYSTPYSDASFDIASVDFEGCELTELHVTVQDVAFTQVYPGIWTNFYAQVRLEVWGFPSSP